jgi:uncharacterized membrane protein YheB (UPF0754 family)
MPEEILRPLLTIAFGALAGGITNSVAIWMLFHPYEPPKVGKRRLTLIQGAVPKNQGRLAAAIGRTVGGRLLTEDDLTRMFANKDFRDAFDERLSAFLQSVLHTERGSLRTLIPPEVLPQVEEMLASTADRALRRLDEYLESEEFEEWIHRKAGGLIQAVAEEPVGEILTPAREAAVAGAVEDWIASAVESEGFRAAVEDYLERGSARLLAPDTTFEEILPLGLVGSLEKAIQGYLPLAIQRLGRLLEDPAARRKFETTLHELLQRFLKDLRFHQRVVARLVMTEETVDKVLDTIEEEGAERLSEMLREEAVQDAMARGVNDAIVDFLRRPVVSVLGSVDDPSVVNARATLTDWVMGIARDPNTRGFLVEKLTRAMDRASERTWGDLLEKVPTDRVAQGLASAARSEPAQNLYRDGARKLVDAFLDRPIGRPATWLPEDAPQRIETSLGDPLWEWMQGQVPDVVRRIDVARRVEDKVRAFPTARLEELVKRVTHRELRLIVRLGYVLGGVIGAALVGINALLS